jgi:hypothetical protein
MIRLKVTNLSQFDTEVRAWKARVEAATAQVAKGVAMFTLKAILKTSPQYSGDFVANWNVSIGSPDYTFNPLPVGEFSRYTEDFSYLSKEGDPRAINVALSKVSIGAYKLGQTIWLTNAAHHDDNYAVLIEENRIKFRPENPSGGRVVARAIQATQSSFSRINKEAALRLAAMGV